MRICSSGVVLIFCLSSWACGKGDNSGAVKANASIKPGMAIWEAIDIAEQSQFADAWITASGKQCSHPGIEVGRNSGPRYVRVIRAESDEEDALSGAYVEEGFGTREEFIKALQSNTALFSGCRVIEFDMGRYEGWWPPADAFEVTVDVNGRVTAVGPLKELGE